MNGNESRNEALFPSVSISFSVLICETGTKQTRENTNDCALKRNLIRRKYRGDCFNRCFLLEKSAFLQGNCEKDSGFKDMRLIF